MLRSACLAALCITASGFSGTAPGAFSSPARTEVSVRARSSCSSLAMVAAGKPGAKINVKAGDFDINKPTKRVGEEPVVKEVIPPPKIETECDADYGPLLKALQDGEWEEADQLTRDMLIWIGGPAMRKRNFVYFAEVQRLPLKDMRTIDNLWTTYSKGKFGYSVQRQIWNSKKVNGDFNKFVTEIDWNKGAGRSGDTGILRRWLPVGAKGNEFIYDLKKAKKSLLAHPAFGSGPMAGSTSGVVAAVVEEKGIMMEEARFDKSPYYKNKKPWDN